MSGGSAAPPSDSDLGPAPLPPPDLQRLGLRLLGGLLLLGLISWAVGVACGSQLERFGRWFVDGWGAPGVGMAVLVLDASPVPLLTEPVFLLALSGGLAPSSIVLAASLGSLAAGACGYLFGWALGRPMLRRLLPAAQRAQARQVVSRWGLWGIALAALTPLPFALCTWTAGALHMRLLPFALGCLFRVPKVAFYVWLVEQAWRAAR